MFLARCAVSCSRNMVVISFVLDFIFIITFCIFSFGATNQNFNCISSPWHQNAHPLHHHLHANLRYMVIPIMSFILCSLIFFHSRSFHLTWHLLILLHLSEHQDTASSTINQHCIPIAPNSLSIRNGNIIVSDFYQKQRIDNQYNALFCGWQSSIRFPAYVNKVYTLECDILQFVGCMKYRSIINIRFCPNTYSIIDEYDGSGFKNLAKDLARVCVDSGFKVARNGLYPFINVSKEKCKAQKFSCSHTFVYRGNTTERTKHIYSALC